jgi:hypothetical protein
MIYVIFNEIMVKFITDTKSYVFNLVLSRNCTEAGCWSFTLEGDSMVIEEALKKSDISSGVYGWVVCDILSHLSNFELLDFSFIHRGGNSVAHEVAKVELL